MTLSKQDVLILAAALVVPVASYFGYFRGQLAEVRQLKAEKQSLEKEVAASERIVSEALEARKNVRLLTARFKELAGTMGADNETAQALDAILADARKAGVTIDFIRPGDSVEGQLLNSTSINLAVSADFKSLHRFLALIESERLVFTINTMELESEPLSDKCTVKLVVQVYSLKAARTERAETQT